MALIDWRKEFEVGVAAVDHEHRELIQLINRLHDSMLSPRSDVTVTQFLGEIYARINAHFALEERIMQDAGYDRFAEHKADHERLLEEIRDIMDDYEDRRRYDDDTLAARLEHWFTEHFKTHDARLHRYLPH
jgi:hemerythrin-like metal-binding protein